MDKMAALCVAIACDSNTRRGQLQTVRKSYDTKRTLQPLPQARIQASAEGITPTNLPPRSRISQDPKRSSLQSLARQVKRYAKRTRLQCHLPLSIRNSAVTPLNFANILLVLLQSTSTHRALATYIHSPLTYQALPKRNSLQSRQSGKTVRKEDKAPSHLPPSICNSAVRPLNFANILLLL